ncbi:MAG TPA: nitroreductase family protein [Acidimicrobiia bacterium]|nr:nitroreductase family protein [Acidimicrobiia bacterium]
MTGPTPARPEPVDFFAVVDAQRACRAFTDAPVSDAVVERVLEAATRAPSAENTQPWTFIVIRDAQTRARIGTLTATAWNRSGRELSRDRLSPGLLADVERGATGGVSGAPVLVVVAADTSRCVESALAASVFPAIQNLLLAAHACGLGSALTTLPTFAPELGRDLGLPDSVRPMAVVPLGHPARPLGPSRRAPVTEKAHRERFGNPW